MNTLDELVRLWGTNENPIVLEQTVRAVLEFSLSENERQSTTVSMNSARHARRIRVAGKDVSQGELIVRLLGSEVHPGVHVHTTKSLADLAESSPNQLKIANYEGVLDVLTSHLQKVDSAWIPGLVQENTLRCLANLAQAHENHTKMASSTVLEPFVKLLGNDAPPRVHLQAARCLTNLAVSEANKERIANYPNVLDALATLLHKNDALATLLHKHDALATLLHKHGGPGVHRQTTECLTNLASSHKVQIKIVSGYPVVLDALVRLLGKNFTPDVQWQSLKCLSNLSDHYQRNQVDIASHSGVLDALLRLLRCNWGATDRITVQFEAARCFHKLLLAPENTLRIASHVGTFDTLVRCLTPSWRIREVQNTAIECFRRLAAAAENQVKIVSFPGTVSALLNLFVQVENSDGQELAAWCLSKLATASEAKVLLTRHRGLLKALVTQLNKPNSRLRDQAMSCLLRLSESEDLAVREKIASQHGIINTLVRLLGNNLDVGLRMPAVNCLSNLALTPKNATQIVSHPRALISLVNLLQLDANSSVLEYTAKCSILEYTAKCSILEYTAKCLTNLACTEESQVKMASFPGMLNALVLSLSVRNELTQQVQEQVVKCLAQLSAPTANHSSMASYPGVYDALKWLAGDYDHPRTQHQASLCLTNLKLSPVADRDRKTISPEEPTGPQRRRILGLGDPDAWFVDPITWHTMCDPVKCNDGVTYDRWTIINNGIRDSPFDHSLSKFFIACDDIDVRRRLFRTFPHQETKFREFRERYREEALQHALSGEYEDAEEKLNSILVWAPSDAECRRELERILNVLEQSIDPDRWDMDPLTYDRMCDPVKCNDGRTYDRWTIVDRDLVRCPYDSNLKPFGIVVDDLNVRRRLFEEFPEQEGKFRTRRTRYREEALQHVQNGEDRVAIRKLSDVLKWAPTDKVCRQELNRSLNRWKDQNFKMRVLNHEDLVRRAKRDRWDQLTLPVVALLLGLGVWTMAKCGFPSIA